MVDSKALCEMGNVNIHKTHIWTTGLNTCIFLCIRTKHCYIGWHFNEINCRGDNMNRINGILNSIKKNEFIEGYIIPGCDRNRNLSLKSDCFTVKCNPQIDRLESGNYFISKLKKFKWFKKLKKFPPVKSYKHFIILNKNGFGWWENDKEFDKGCVFDAGNIKILQ